MLRLLGLLTFLNLLRGELVKSFVVEPSWIGENMDNNVVNLAVLYFTFS